MASRRFLVACYSDLMWTRVDSCIYVLNALTDAGKRGVWLSNGSNLCFYLWDLGGIYMPSAWMAHLAPGCL